MDNQLSGNPDKAAIQLPPEVALLELCHQVPRGAGPQPRIKALHKNPKICGVASTVPWELHLLPLSAAAATAAWLHIPGDPGQREKPKSLGSQMEQEEKSET